MATGNTKLLKRKRRHNRIRATVHGSTVRPRLCVFRSARHIYAQLIDDASGRTLAASSSNDGAFGDEGGARGSNIAGARKVGETLARKAADRGITAAVFDRAGYQYHGRVKALAEGARAGGLQF